MSSCYEISRLVAVIIIIAVTTPALAEEDLVTRAKQYLQTDELVKAKLCLEEAIAKHPGDATSHYLMGNVLVDLKFNANAIEEYSKAYKLDPKSPAGQYSAQALTSLSAAKQQQQQQQQQQFGQAPQENSHSKSDDPDLIKRSATAVSRETNEKESHLSAECERRVREIQRDADARIASLNSEMEQRIADNGQVQYAARRPGGRLFLIYDPAPLNKQVKDEFEPKIEAVKEDARKHTTEVISSYQQNISSVEDSAATIDNSYLNRSAAKGVVLTPHGTDMFVRSYQTADDPSGNPLPVRAAPAKSLAPTKATSNPINTQVH